MRKYVNLSRPKHWLKNILIFIPIVYAQKLFELDLFISTIQAFIAFCIISSATYAVNDIVDAEKDRQHPIKKKRPIASGQITKFKAIIFALFLFVVGFSLSFFVYGNQRVLLFSVIYMLLNLAYSFKLKNLAIIDCFCIATGFILRIFAGGASYGGGVSDWLFLTIFTMSIFMAFGKRRGEFIRVTDTNATRKVLSSYNLDFFNGMIFSCAGLAIVFYSLWAMMNIAAMVYTVPLVIFIICKYLLTIYGKTSHGDPTSVIFGDKVLLIASGVLGVLSFALLYV